MPDFPPPANPEAVKHMPVHERPQRPFLPGEEGGTDEGHGPPDQALEAQAQAILAKAEHQAPIHGQEALPDGVPGGE